jgi:hypothetical protein
VNPRDVKYGLRHLFRGREGVVDRECEDAGKPGRG